MYMDIKHAKKISRVTLSLYRCNRMPIIDVSKQRKVKLYSEFSIATIGFILRVYKKRGNEPMRQHFYIAHAPP